MYFPRLLIRIVHVGAKWETVISASPMCAFETGMDGCNAVLVAPLGDYRRLFVTQSKGSRVLRLITDIVILLVK